ncbi:MAG: hypothetical protein LUB63_01915, partial [Oscillospiraceae bacterium]|nr:hypothetical protein [Oscillospiraceae bacterium]
GPYLKEGFAVVVRGKLSVREEKAPQILCDSLNPLTDPQERPADAQRLYLRLPGEGPLLDKVKLIFSMFPGSQEAILLLADTGKRLGTRCQLHPALIEDMRERLGEENVVVK